MKIHSHPNLFHCRLVEKIQTEAFDFDGDSQEKRKKFHPNLLSLHLDIISNSFYFIFCKTFSLQQMKFGLHFICKDRNLFVHLIYLLFKISYNATVFFLLDSSFWPFFIESVVSFFFSPS